MHELFSTLFETTDDFDEHCPRCGKLLSDRTAVDRDRGMLFYRVRFTCRACGFWLCTRLENFCVLGPVPDEDEPVPAYLAPADQRIRHDLTQMLVRQLMPSGVESYEGGRVWVSDQKTVTKTWSKFSVGGLHVCLALLAKGYMEQDDETLGTRALELAVEALRSADKADPSLSDDHPEKHRNAARVLAYLAGMYEYEGRQEEAQRLLAEARTWAPEMFDEQDGSG